MRKKDFNGLPIENGLEPITRYFRFKKGINRIKDNKKINLVDLGCGPEIAFYKQAKKNGINFNQYIGIDPRVNKDTIKEFKDNKEVKLITTKLSDKIPLPTNSADYVVGFAFLEHVDNPDEIFNESLRILKKNGKIVMTVPSINAKEILEFLAFKLNLISKREINEHKNYFDKKSLNDLINRLKFKTKAYHQYFELGLNNLLVLEKIKHK